MEKEITIKNSYYKIKSEEEFKFLARAFTSYDWRFFDCKDKDQVFKRFNWDEYPCLIFDNYFKRVNGYGATHSLIKDNSYTEITFDKVIKLLFNQKIEYYYDEFIVAMKEIAKEYIDGTHKYNNKTCKLCQVTSSKGYLIGKTIEGCKICPWVVLTGTCCIQITDGLERARNLLDWVKQYETLSGKEK